MQSIFNILGPAMIGPSSSHTAGAEKLGRVIFVLTGGDVKSVVFKMHGSFAATSKGHGTELALLAGVMGLSVMDENIKDADKIALDRGLSYEFIAEDDHDQNEHPNTVIIEATGEKNNITAMKGSSVGGGNILVTAINGVDCSFTGDYSAVVVRHLDKVGTISKITALLERCNTNIVTLTTGRITKGRTAYTMIETDTEIEPDVVAALKEIPNVQNVQTLSKLT